QDGDDNYNPATAIIETVAAQKASATVTLANDDLSQYYDGNAKSVNYTTVPADLSGITVAYAKNNNTVNSPVNAGTYTVSSALVNDNYEAEPASGTLVIEKAPATITIDNLLQVYSGAAKSVSLVTSPAGLTTVN